VGAAITPARVSQWRFSAGRNFSGTRCFVEYASDNGRFVKFLAASAGKCRAVILCGA
jgi:hypothetical protein